jgi:hypothetical protein
MKLIYISRGMFAEVSDHRFDELSRYRWFACWDRKGRKWYAVRAFTKAEGGGTISMHRQIMGCCKGDGKEVDHIKSEQSLNNQDDNLRFATRAQQNQNRGPRRDNTSGYRGVSKVPGKEGWWKAQTWVNGTNKVIWTGTDPAEGFEVYKAKIIEMHGEFARFD